MRKLLFLIIMMCLAAVAQQSTPLKHAPAGKTFEMVFEKSPQLILEQTADWSEYEGIGLTVTTNRALSIRPSLIIQSEDEKSPGMDYYQCQLPVMGKGTHEFILPFSELSKTRKPVGWHKIDLIEFHADWSGQKRYDRDAVMVISNLRLLKGLTMEGGKGPRLTDEAFFDMLDYSRPELAAVKAAADKQDYKAARAALGQHIRTRKTPVWTAEPWQRPSRGHAAEKRRAAAGQGGVYTAPLLLDWTGWREVEIPMSSLKASGKPVGMDYISDVRLSWLPLTDCSVGAALHLDDIRLVYNDGTECLMGDFERYATGWQGIVQDMAMPHSGKASGKWQFPRNIPIVSCRCFPDDWRNVKSLKMWLHVADKHAGTVRLQLSSYLPNTEAADRILSHKFAVGSFKKVIVDFGPRIDWSTNPMKEGETATVEWNAQLNRCFHFNTLVDAYWKTGDDVYAKELADEMNGWIEDNPVLLLKSGNGPYHYAWETLNTGIRMHDSWPWALSHCIESPAFTDDIIVNIMKSCAEHVSHLRRWPSKGNWLTAESWGVYTVGLLFPEFKLAKEWRLYGIDQLYHQLSEEVYPDGVQYELALGYNTWTLAEFMGAYEAALINDMTDEFPADYKSLIEKMYGYLMKVCMPSGRAFGLNDAGCNGVVGQLINGYQRFPHREDFLHAAFQGNEAFRKPETDSFGMHWAGHYVMRSGWKPEDAVMLMDAGPWGKGHQHEDMLSIALYACGQLLLPDGGTTMYDHSRWRAYQLLTRAHNSVLVDGMDQYNGRGNYFWPLPWTGDKPDTESRWFSTPSVDFAEGWFKRQYREYTDFALKQQGFVPKILDGIRHRRGVTFIKPQLWIVHDTLFAEDDNEHTAEVLYHIQADAAEVLTKPCLTAMATSAKNAGLAIAAAPQEGMTLDIVKGKMEPPVQGWSAVVTGNRPEGVPMSPLPTAIFHQPWRKRCDIVTVLRPFAAGEAVQPVVTLRPVTKRPEDKEVTLSVNVTVSETESYNWIHDEGKDQILVFSEGKTPKAQYLIDGAKGIANSVVELSPHVTIASRSTDGPLSVLMGAVVMSPAVYRLDRNSRRVETVKAVFDAPSLSWQGVAGAEYEVVWGETPSAEELRHPKKAEPTAFKAEVRPLPPCGTAPAGTVVTMQAEAPTAQGGGTIEVTDKKLGADGKAFLHWDNPGHWLEYAVDVPHSGAYALEIKYCLSGDAAVRAILVDGACPDGSLANYAFSETGGWSGQTDDWQWHAILEVKGKAPFRFNLSKGRHVLRLINVRNSMNMDVLRLKALP